MGNNPNAERRDRMVAPFVFRICTESYFSNVILLLCAAPLASRRTR